MGVATEIPLSAELSRAYAALFHLAGTHVDIGIDISATEAVYCALSPVTAKVVRPESDAGRKNVTYWRLGETLILR